MSLIRNLKLRKELVSVLNTEAFGNCFPYLFLSFCIRVSPVQNEIHWP
jgi:hypothetical protein